MKIRLLLVFLITGTMLSAQSFSSNELIAKLDIVNSRSIDVIKNIEGVLSTKLISKTQKLILVTFRNDVLLSTIERKLKNKNNVLFVQKNYKVETRAVPNDPFWSSQWNLTKISVDKVWDLNIGGESPKGDEIVIAVFDDGFQLDHPDLINNIWHNSSEIPDNGIDDDNNGYFDDVDGWNFVSNTDTHPLRKHGTSVSGIIGASGDNGLGISGINQKIKLMLLSNVNDVAKIVLAYEYVRDMRKLYNDTNGAEGAFVVATNFSAGSDFKFAVNFPLWCQVFDDLGEVGILNVAAVSNKIYDVDELGDMPTTCSSNYLITVTNTSQIDTLDAAFGGISVDIGAPGDNVITTDKDSNYNAFSGSSASSPHVAGAIGLLYATACEDFIDQIKINPASGAISMKNALLSGVDTLLSLVDLTASQGRLNVFEGLKKMQSLCGGSLGKLDIKFHKFSAAGNATFLYESPDFDEYKLQIIDALGRLIHAEDILPPIFGEKTISVETKYWSSGIYYFSIYNANSNASGGFYKL